MEMVSPVLTVEKNIQSLASDDKAYNKMITRKDGGLLLEDTISWIQSALKEGRLEDVASKIEETLRESENIPLNIALTGESATGKSTFINALRGIGHEEEDSASSGVVETTMKPVPYQYPKYPNVKLWDLPGIGTPNFHPDTYLDQVNFKKYDFFIIISDSRLTVNDVKLAQEIRKMNKKFYFVRTKVDSDLANEKKSKPESFSKEKVLQNIRDNILKNLSVDGLSEAQVFLVSNFDLSDYDFPKLEERLIEDLPDQKRHTLLLALPAVSEATIERKKAAMGEKIWLEALKTAVWATVPLVGFTLNDIATQESHLNHYRNAFGVDDASLVRVAEKLGKPVEEIKAGMKSLDLISLLKDQRAPQNLLKIVENICSAVGVIFGAAFQYKNTFYMHWHLLDAVTDDAKNLLWKILKDSE